PLSHEDTSFGQQFMMEYLVMKDFFKNRVSNAEFLDAFSIFKMCEVVDGKVVKPEPAGLWKRNLSRVLAVLFFRRNRTARDFRKHFDLLIEGAEQKPPDFSRSNDYSEKYTRRPRLRNLGGWFVVAMAAPSYCRAQETASETKVWSDLLAIELYEQLGESIKLQDYFTGGEYFLDEETGTWRSAGPDKKQGTKDDIWIGKD
ncbi:hypothetical protein ACFLS1_10380, partial [Verrucomicrobiota bacterium]